VANRLLWAATMVRWRGGMYFEVCFVFEPEISKSDPKPNCFGAIIPSNANETTIKSWNLEFEINDQNDA
jgi:hypothetical protein